MKKTQSKKQIVGRGIPVGRKGHGRRNGMFVLGAMVLFGGGILAGTGLGSYLSPGQGTAPIEQASNPDAQNGDEGALNGSNDAPPPPSVPVIVHTREGALQAYEERRSAPGDGTGSILGSVESQQDPSQDTTLYPDIEENLAEELHADPVVPISEAPVIPGLNPAPLAQDTPATAPQVAALPPINFWERFAAASTVVPGKPMIAIVIDDVGIDQPRSKATIALPSPITVALLPYGYNLQSLTDAARSKGHEVLLHLPMAPTDLSVDPGPNALHQELGRDEILRRLDWNLAQLDGYVGVNNHMGSRFTAQGDVMALVMAELRRRGLLYLDSVTTTQTQGYRIAASLGMDYAVRDIFLDHRKDPVFIRSQLAKVEAVAREQGHAIAIGHPYDATRAELQAWMADVQNRGFQLVPLSAIVRYRRANG